MGARLEPALPLDAKKGQGLGEIFMKKLPPGAPEIAHPRDAEKYEWQMAFITAWFTEMVERVESDDDEPAQGARDELQTLWLNALGTLLKLAMEKRDSSMKQWAGMLLASIFVSIYKHDSEKGKAGRVLSKTNEAYPGEKQTRKASH
jgi:hypothetical protein